MGGLPEAEELARQVPDLDLGDARGHDLTPEEKIELARRCEAAALEADPRITNSEGGDFSDRRARYAYATSHGFAGEYETSSFSLAVSPVASENGQMQRDSWYHVTRKRARLEAPEEIGRIAARRAVRRLGARQVKTAEVPVIFDPEMAASLVRHIAGAVGRPVALPARLLPGGQAGRAHRGPGGDHRGRRHHSGGPRLAPVRRRGAAGAAHRDRGAGRAALLPARHLQRPQARPALHPSRGARRQRGERVHHEPAPRRRATGSGGPDPEREERPLRHRADRLRRQRGHRRLLARGGRASGSRTASWPTRWRRSPSRATCSTCSAPWRASATTWCSGTAPPRRRCSSAG